MSSCLTVLADAEIPRLEMTDFQTTGVKSNQEPLAELTGIGSAYSDRVQAFILLGGGLSPSPLTASTHCSVLDLLIGPSDSTVLDRWMLQVSAINGLASEDMPIIIANGSTNPVPHLGARSASCRIELVVDKEAYRGAAGVVCDVSSHLTDDALLLVAEAARCPDFDLAASVWHHKASGSDATVLVNPDNTPAGVYLMARHLLKFVQREGYMDLKEQWLDKVIQSDHHVGVHRISTGYSRPLRTREQLLNAARAAANGPGDGLGSLRFGSTIPTREGHGFRCVAPDAHIDDTAVVVDSIIMPGASVGASSIVTRSIVCANCHIPVDGRLVDAVHGPSDTARTTSTGNGTPREQES